MAFPSNSFGQRKRICRAEALIKGQGSDDTVYGNQSCEFRAPLRVLTNEQGLLRARLRCNFQGIYTYCRPEVLAHVLGMYYACSQSVT